MLGPFEGPSFSVVFHSELLHLALIRTLQLLVLCIRAIHVVASSEDVIP